MFYGPCWLICTVFLDLYYEHSISDVKHLRKRWQVSQHSRNSWNSVSTDKLTFHRQPTHEGFIFQGDDKVAVSKAFITSLHLDSLQNINLNLKAHQRSVKAWIFPFQLVRDIGILIYLVIMWTSSDRVLLKIKLSKCVQSNRSISQSHHVTEFNTKINYEAMRWVRQMLCWLQSRYICFSPTIAADSAADSTVTGLVQGYISLNMPGINLVKFSYISCSLHLWSMATVGKWSVPREAQRMRTAIQLWDTGRETAALIGN